MAWMELAALYTTPEGLTLAYPDFRQTYWWDSLLADRPAFRSVGVSLRPKSKDLIVKLSIHGFFATVDLQSGRILPNARNPRLVQVRFLLKVFWPTLMI